MPVLLHNHLATSSPEIRERIDRAAFESFLLVVPTRRRLRHLARELLRGPGSPAAHALQGFTLETLATRLFARLSPSYRSLRPVAQTLLFMHAIRTAGERFSYFTLRKGAFPLPRGTFRTLTQVITGLKEAGVTPEVLDEEALIAEPDEVHKLRDVIAIYRAYEAALEISGSRDIAGIFRTFSLGTTHSRFEAAFREVFPAVDLIEIAGFDEFTEPEIGFLRKVLALPRVAVRLAFDYRPGNPALFGHLEENYERFRGLGLRDAAVPAAAEAHRSGAEEPGSEIGRLAASLFAPATGERRAALSGAVTVVRARNREAEAEAVCRFIKRLALDRPETDLSRICVAMVNPSLYTEHFRRTFARYGVPANITDRFELGRSPLVTGILGLLQAAARGYRRDDVLRVAGLPYFSFPGLSGTPDCAALATVSGRLKITGGPNAWLGRIDREAAELAARAGTAPDLRQRAALEQEARRLAAARKTFVAVRDVLAPFEAPVPPAQFRARLNELLSRLGVERGLAWTGEAIPHDRRERDARAFRKFLEVVDDVVMLMSDTGDTAHPPGEYLDHLSVAVAGERYNVRERTGRGVLVTAIEETRGLPVDVMVLVGLVDGEFPTVYQPEVFYSLARQKKRARRHVWEQRYLFYQAVSNWKEQLVITYPEQDQDLECVRSTFVDALRAAAEVSELTAGDMPGAGEILSEQELLRACGASPALRNGAQRHVPRATAERLDALALGAEVETSRMVRHDRPAFEGHVGGALDPADAARLQAMRGRVFSVSRLETYAACPFRYFAEALLRLTPTEDLNEELSPIEKGSLLHEVLFEFMTGRRGRSLPDLRQCSDEDFAAASAELMAIARARLDRLEIPDPFWQLERDLLLGTGKHEGVLASFLACERARTTDFAPRYFEVAFGPSMRSGTSPSDAELSADDPITVGDIRLRGRIDRIETGEGGFTIVDYKTGTAPMRFQDVRTGLSLQIPLYLRAVQKLLRDRIGREARPAAGIHYRLAPVAKLEIVMANERFRGTAFDAGSRSRQIAPDDAAFEAAIDRTVAMAGKSVHSIAEGRFPLAASENVPNVCRTCGYSTVCRIQLTQRIGPDQGETG